MGLPQVYAESDNPRCGMVRDSSRHNWNLVKAELGHPRRVTQKIRDPLFIYGRPNERRALGVKEVIVHLETVPVPQGDRYGPDFKAMNKAAAINHYCKSNEQRAARERFYFHIQPKNTLNTRTKLPSDKNPHHTYGLTIQGEGPIAKVINGAYQDEWIEMNQYFKSKYPERFIDMTGRMEVIQNKATDLYTQHTRKRLAGPPCKQRFLLSKFKNVPKRIDNENQTPLNRGPPFHKFYGCEKNAFAKRCQSR